MPVRHAVLVSGPHGNAPGRPCICFIFGDTPHSRVPFSTQAMLRSLPHTSVAPFSRGVH